MRDRPAAAAGTSLPPRWDACFAACGCLFPGASPPSCAAFLRDARSQQSVLLCVGIYSFVAILPLYAVSLTAFAYGLTAACLVFSFSMIFDVLLIAETRKAADEARAFSPALAHALTARLSWRWYAFALSAASTVLMLWACVLYLQAAAAGEGVAAAAIAAHDTTLANTLFAACMVGFVAGFMLVSADALITMRDAACATGAPEPGPWDETRVMLLTFLVCLTLITTANLLVLSTSHAAAVALLPIGGAGALLGLIAAAWQLRVQWRDFHAAWWKSSGGGASSSLEQAEQGRELAAGAPQQQGRGGRGGAGGGDQGRAAGERTLLLGGGGGGGGGAPRSGAPRRALDACASCFRARGQDGSDEEGAKLRAVA
jgi:hypothetical protein